MNAKETNFLKFLDGTKQFNIPIYQRTYSWDLRQCEQLYNDICRTGEEENSFGHFIGSIVYVEKGLYQISAVPQLLVIDGQQRLTTLSLLLFALSRKLKQIGETGDVNDRKILNKYLLNNDESGDNRFKLVLTQSDKQTLYNLLAEKELPNNASRRIKDNFDFFLEKLEKANIQSVYQGISKLFIIDVALDKDKDNPQLIFESLNATGLALSQADLIRNYILMGLPNNEQVEIYNDYWYKMEQGFGHAEYSALFDRFMRDYLTIKTGSIPNINDVYSAFKSYSVKFPSIKDLVADIYRYSKYFVRIALNKEENASLMKAFLDINDLKVDVSYPFILSVYADFEANVINEQDFIKILRLIESYVFRRTICGIPTNSLNKTFATLYKELDTNAFVESFMATLLLKDSYRRFPENEEFSRELLAKDVYNFRNRNYLLRKLENYDRKEIVDVESYTIEHIMPQNENLSAEWKLELGENWKEVQKRYLHTIGNLTLTGYNSELSDRPFLEKKTRKGGFKDSPIRLNRRLATLEHWNETEIVERAKEIAELAVKAWICPALDPATLEKYKKTEELETEKNYKLEDYEYLTGSTKELFDELRKRILNLESSVKEEVLKYYIAYKTITNFCDIEPQKRNLKIFLNLKFEELNDPKGICQDVGDIGHRGNGEVEVKLASLEDIDYMMFLIKQALDKRADGEAEGTDSNENGEEPHPVRQGSAIKGTYDLVFHLNKIESVDVKKRVEELRIQILAISGDVKEHFSKAHINFNLRYDFAAIYCQKVQFWVDVKLNKKEVKDEGLDIRPMDDEVWTHIRVHIDTDLSKILSVVKQAYEVNKK